jgi:2'-5' RNA ligase
LEGEIGALRALQADVARAVAAFAEEKAADAPEPFAAHITLGRVKALAPRERSLLVAAAQQCGQSPPAPWLADRVQLMRSTLGAGGARHECLAVWRLESRPAAP